MYNNFTKFEDCVDILCSVTALSYPTFVWPTAGGMCCIHSRFELSANASNPMRPTHDKCKTCSYPQ